MIKAFVVTSLMAIQFISIAAKAEPMTYQDALRFLQTSYYRGVSYSSADPKLILEAIDALANSRDTSDRVTSLLIIETGKPGRMEAAFKALLKLNANTPYVRNQLFQIANGYTNTYTQSQIAYARGTFSRLFGYDPRTGMPIVGGCSISVGG